MRAFRALLAKELHVYFASPLVYLVAAAFLAYTGYYFHSDLVYFLTFGFGMNIMENFWQVVFMDIRLVLIFSIPLLTMRLLAEERRLGTLDLLVTYPASDRAIVATTRLYREAFLDPADWQTGTYDALWEDFATTVKVRARKDARILTAGSAAGDAYEGIVPRHSTVATTVLLDRKGKPAVVLVTARFEAFGRTVSGPSNTRFDSTGRFFFERVGGGWKIVSYDVRRHDRRVAKTAPSPAPVPAASPTEAT